MKGNPNIVSEPAAKKALEIADGDRQAAYSEYIKLFFNQTGELNPRCDNKDLQAFYRKEYGSEHQDKKG